MRFNIIIHFTQTERNLQNYKCMSQTKMFKFIFILFNISFIKFKMTAFKRRELFNEVKYWTSS